jgi:hypothetical protein
MDMYYEQKIRVFYDVTVVDAVVHYGLKYRSAICWQT